MNLTAIVNLADCTVDIFIGDQEDPIGSLIFGEIVVLGRNGEIITQTEEHEHTAPATEGG